MLISIGGSLLFTLPLGMLLSGPRFDLGPDGLFIAQFCGAVVSTTVTGAWVATGNWTRVRTHSTRP
jgi:Na+-driven multidrug efflux pump